ncbi:phage protein [Rhodococcus aetherivorans]|uniref:Phage protein n=1 Tax=Rhodococcus aetherivorans TaxID=191292 RepID=A0ABQ0YVM5_9NOCA|nr:hypothetical protein [Rhodococcus aetherivorans]ETT26253.1 protein of unknown function DUF935 [Rhodococcus rhodochrous ATCC 21198]NGP25852.1 hypothetical protein [Rhodococcus aetherivorans]GES40528.1 phage protein [Rhodococcus aetherivorans]
MAETTGTPSSFRETGYVNGSGMTEWQQWMSGEKVPDLRWPRSIAVFDRMTREDTRISSVLDAISLPVLGTGWRIDGAGARDEVTEFVADNLGLPIKGADEPRQGQRTRSRGRFSWRLHLEQALLQNKHGHSYFEQVYRPGEDGRIWLRKLAPRPAATIRAIHVALDGGLESIEQHAPAGAPVEWLLRPQKIPVSRLVAYVRKPEPGPYQWIGQSMLRPAYKHWILKDELMRIQAAAARRNGIGVPVFWASPEESEDPEKIEKYRQMASQYRGGESSGVGLPKGADAKLLGVQGNLPDLQQAIAYHDKQMALAGLAHYLNLDGGGSYALASVQENTFVQSVQSQTESVRDTANAHIVEDLVDLNFGVDEPAPRIEFDDIGARQDLTASALKLLIDAGLIRLDRSLEEFTRQQYGLPPKDTPPPEQPWTPGTPNPQEDQ